MFCAQRTYLYQFLHIIFSQSSINIKLIIWIKYNCFYHERHKSLRHCLPFSCTFCSYFSDNIFYYTFSLSSRHFGSKFLQ
ncbi:hypothetical protein EB796_006560 [Bugula neritina]|uniref:Uncharacterized protein n=1 Tax=Bugula neritina TaxID=10212 RepID=A0A7J7KA93_BUGNE|nr:hypothetical protein EB796_006560 [Bugula neritina]